MRQFDKLFIADLRYRSKMPTLDLVFIVHQTKLGSRFLEVLWHKPVTMEKLNGYLKEEFIIYLVAMSLEDQLERLLGSSNFCIPFPVDKFT